MHYEIAFISSCKISLNTNFSLAFFITYITTVISLGGGGNITLSPVP